MMVPIWKYVRALRPVMPTFLRSATLAIPPMMVRKTMGLMSIFIAAMNVVPIGAMAWPRSGQRHPTTIPTTMAIRTWT